MACAVGRVWAGWKQSFALLLTYHAVECKQHSRGGRSEACHHAHFGIEQEPHGHGSSYILTHVALAAFSFQDESRKAERVHARVYRLEQKRQEHDDNSSFNPALHRSARVHRNVGNAVVVRASDLQLDHAQQLLRTPQHAPHINAKGDENADYGYGDDGFQIGCVLEERAVLAAAE